MKETLLAKTKYKENFWLVWQTGFNDVFKTIKEKKFIRSEELENDISVILVDSKGKRLGDAICHYGSYGVENGEWETMIEGKEDVQGHLTFKDVIKNFDFAIRHNTK